ncbi:MAG: hypothetical protein PF445_08405 [Melioribacteraceae bacterium]|nr:hypothetical protein [Melioribacteraceae bacterium]
MKYTKLLVLALIMISAVACQNTDEKNTKSSETFAGHKATVVEVLNGKTYTYLRLSENDNEYWAAISLRDTKVDEVLFFIDGLEMENFESKELGRTFDKIVFVSKVSDSPISKGKNMTSAEVKGTKPVVTKADLKIKVPKGGITIAELYSNRDSYSGKSVVIKGKITKVNNEIMGRNWAHIQDGTSDNDNFDLTLTSHETFKVGDIVTFKGTIAISKDFGAGYFYEVIMESATIVDSQAI